MRKMLRKITTMVTAAALAMTLTPASALAHEQTTASVQLGSSTANGVSVGDDVAQDEGASENIPALYATARANQMSVDAPVRVTFEGAGNAAYDVNNKAAWGTPTANVTFTNWHSKNVYIKNVAVKQDASANVGKVFSGTVGSAANPFLTLQNASANGTETATLSTLAPNTSSSNNMQFGTNAAAAEQEKVAKRFKIRKNTTGSGNSTTFALKMNPANATVKDAADLQSANSLNGNTTDFAKIVWTFAVQPVFEEGKGSDAASEAFYLKVNEDPATEELQSYAGEIYSLDQVKTHSKKLGSNVEGTDSDMYEFYHAIVTSMYPEQDYSCVALYAGKPWRLRIIGLNQDYASGASGGGNYAYNNGDRVGLTFQFLNYPAQTKMADSNATGGWGGASCQIARTALSPNGSIYNGLSIRNSIVPVRKYYSSRSSTEAGSMSSVTSSMFILSVHELCGSIQRIVDKNVSSYTWLAKEGVGKNSADAAGEQYLFYQGKTTGGDACGTDAIKKWLIKVPGYDATTTHVTSTSWNTDSYSYNSWTRTLFPGNDGHIVQLTKGGSFYGSYIMPTNNFWIAPAFCL